VARSFRYRELCPVHRSFIAMSGTVNGGIIANSLIEGRGRWADCSGGRLGGVRAIAGGALLA